MRASGWGLCMYSSAKGWWYEEEEVKERCIMWSLPFNEHEHGIPAVALDFFLWDWIDLFNSGCVCKFLCSSVSKIYKVLWKWKYVVIDNEVMW